MHVLVEENTSGRDFVVGDIHGHFDLLHEELAYAGFNHHDDRLFSVGDLIDRGPKSLQCLELLNQSWFYAVCGNHEQMMIDFVLHNAFPNWRRDYGQWLDNISDEEAKIWATRLDDLPVAMTLQCTDYKVGICHAEPAGLDWDKVIKDPDSSKQMMWGRTVLRGEGDLGLVKGIDFTVHGHTPVSQPRRIGNRYFLDTGAGDGDSLTVKRLDKLFEEYSDYKIFL
jgi:serine/threonine protein phosphatase 1